MKLYSLHSPKDGFYGCDSQSLESTKILAKFMGLDMIRCLIPNGLNTYEEQHPDKAVIFDVSSEDVVMVQKE
jgi:hypothetical protein